MVIGSLLIVADRKAGHQERAFVAGVKPLEVLSGHMLTCFLAVVSQVSITILLAFVVFKLENNGSLLEIFILIFLQGIQGLSVGLVISMLCIDEVFASVSLIHHYGGLQINFFVISGGCHQSHYSNVAQFRKHVADGRFTGNFAKINFP